MIPYVNFGSCHRTFEEKNPFTAKEEPIVVFIDRASFSYVSELEFLFRQADGESLYVVSTEKEGSAHLEYLLRDDDVLEFSVTKLDGSSSSRHGIPSLSQIKHLATVPEFTRWASAEEVERAFIAARTAEDLGAHVFITNDKFLLEHKNIGIIEGSSPMNLAEATALIGLIRRRRNNYAIVADRQGASTITFNHARWLFFWYASRDMLPAAWGLVTSCAQMPSDKCRDLALTAISRTSDALKCRDHIHEQIFLEQTNSSTEDAIFYLDFYLINFTAAFDVLARISEDIYKPTDPKGDPIKTISWRNQKWLKALTAKDAKLAALMVPKAFHRDVLDFIAILRNYIHAEGLQGAMHTKDGKTAPLLLHVPRNEVTKIADIIKRLSGGSWVVDRPRDDVMFLEIGDLVEKITPLAIEALNVLMGKIDTTRIQGFDPSKVQTNAPDKWATKSELADIRKFLGL